MGNLSAVFRRGGHDARADRRACRTLSRRVGHHATVYRRVVGPRRPQRADCLGHVVAGGRHCRDDSELGPVLLGAGTAMVYPTLLAAIGDVAHPAWRASAVGVYRLWRDLGYAIGALLAGIVADALGLAASMGLVAAITFGSGVIVALRMSETLAARQRATN